MGIVSVIGRPNVGKSTFFNRLIGMRKAIVDEQSGVTRDRHYGVSDWNGKDFTVIDTGGYAINSDDAFEEAIRRQVILAIDESDIILFMVDVTCGITDYDDALATVIRKSKKKVLLVVNKVDNYERECLSAEFYKLGLGTPYCVSSMTGSGTGELLDELVKLLPDTIDVTEQEQLPKFAIVGRPNVGKSSLTNALLGEERTIVTDIAGTTRDSILARYNKFGHNFYLVDTAGLRKKGKTMDDLEFYSVMRTIRAIETSDVCILMIDATQGVEAQDMNIFSLILRNRKGCIIAVNKWDLIEKSTNTARDMKKLIERRIEPFSDVPIIFTSATDKTRVFDLVQQAVTVGEQRSQRISTSKLNDILLPIIEATPPPSHKGKYVKIKYITQLPTPFPAFVFFANLPQYVKEPYRRFLENQLREKFNFTGVPIEVYIRQK